jgi:lipopolysaccharide biosynthesis protein
MHDASATPVSSAGLRRGIVLAHFDRRGAFDPHVVQAVRRYRRVAERLVVVSSSATALPPPIRDLVDTFVSRDNVGYDFGSWKAGLATLRPTDFDELICVNDSVYGPLSDLGPVLAEPRTAGADLWGMVLSQQATKSRGGRLCPHIQSWFLGMRRRLIESPVFADFWNSVEPLPTKEGIIDRYEIGLSERCLEAGLRIAGIYDSRAAGPVRFGELWPHLSLTDPRRSWRLWKKGRRTPHNPSELVWWRLLDAGVPYLKVGLFRVNHYGLDLDRVSAELGRRHPEAVGMIQEHLARCG